jgi:hypothetical protein
MNHDHTKCHTSCFSDAVVIAVKREALQTFRVVSVLLFYIVHRGFVILESLSQHNILGPCIKWRWYRSHREFSRQHCWYYRSQKLQIA